MTYTGWLFVMGALGFVDGWLACWWVSLIAQHRRQKAGGELAEIALREYDSWIKRRNR